MIDGDIVRNLLKQPEGPKLEFKREVNLEEKYPLTNLLYRILALANSLGGTAFLIIGVDDKTREVVGLADSKGLTEETLQTVVREYCAPPITFTYEKVEIRQSVVGIIAIPPSGLKPHYFKKDIQGSFPDKKPWMHYGNRIFSRSGSTTVEATSDEIVLMHREAESNKTNAVTIQTGNDNPIRDKQISEDKYENSVFVSYAWEDESERIVDELEGAFLEHGILIVRDKKALDYKESIKTFEQRIGQGQCVILLISNKYLRSEHCMYELVEVKNNQKLGDRIFPIVLSDAQIYKAKDRLVYINYWDDQIKELNQAIRQVELMTNLDSVTADLERHTSIRANFDALSKLLSDMNALTPEIHASSGYSTLINAIKRVLANGKLAVAQSTKTPDQLQKNTDDGSGHFLNMAIIKPDHNPEQTKDVNIQTNTKMEEDLNQNKTTIPITFSPPPKSRGFLGREKELELLNKELSKSPIVLIEGLPGIGKTSFTAQYIRQIVSGKIRPVFWLECQENTNIDYLLMAFSDYGWQTGDIALANVIKEDRPLNERIHKLIELLDSRSSLLILDGFERTDKVSMQMFAQEVLEHSDQFKMIICTRERPKNFMNFLTDIGEICLGGLTEEVAVELIKRTNILEDEKLLQKVAQKTEGHPLAIRLFIPLVRDYGISPIDLLNDSPEYGKSLEEHWLSEIFSRLSIDERNILENLSIYLEPITKEGIQYIAPNQEMDVHLRSLQDKFLVNSSKNVFSMHALIREYCFTQLSNRGLITQSANRAAEFYLSGFQISEYVKDISSEEVASKLRAHYYLLLAGQFFLAAKIVHNIESSLMRLGQTSQLLALIDETFETLDDEKLEPDQKLEWNIIARWLDYYKGRILFTRGQFTTSLQIFEKLVSTGENDLLAECIQMLANIYLEQEKPLDVIRLFENNLKLFRQREKKIERVFDKVARAYIQVGDLDKALSIYKQLLNWQQADDDQFGGAITLRQLALIYYTKKDLVNALNLGKLSEELAKQSGDQYLHSSTSMTLGDIYENLNDCQSAIDLFETALQCFIDLNNVSGIRQVGQKLLKLYTNNQNKNRLDEIHNLIESLNEGENKT